VQVLFGGTFDPVHNGHVVMAESLAQAFPDATVHVIPNRQPPHRESQVSAEHRLAMLNMAMEGIPQITVNAIELGRDGPSYTVDTLRAFRAQFAANESLVLCLGADAVRAVDQWYRPELLVQLAHLCILNRANRVIEIPKVLGSYQSTDNVSDFSNQANGLLSRLATPDVPVSSTDVRGLIAKHALTLPVPPKIADYIGRHHLYQDTE
jgi:nicotinate-nucleotide adenylyltransferase